MPHVTCDRDARDRERVLAEAYAEAVNERDPVAKRRKLAALQQGSTSMAEVHPVHHGAAGALVDLSTPSDDSG